jgi:hypothetical protein
MRQSTGTNGHASKSIGEHLRHAGTIVHHAHKRAIGRVFRHLSKFGRIVCGLWENKPAAHLAHAAHISERNANQLISGERSTITLQVMHAVEGEVLSE